MKPLRAATIALSTTLLALPSAYAQNITTPSASAKPPATTSAPPPRDQTFSITHTADETNARVGLGIGLGLPGFVAFQASYASFGAIVPGLYLDLRLTGTTLGEPIFGTGSPLWQDSFEFDLRVGYGNRKFDEIRGKIRDSDGNEVDSYIPGTFGVTPYLGYRGRWGYRAQQFRLGLHVERSSDVAVQFTDNRTGRHFKQWAFDFEISVSGNEMKGFGAQAGFDQWFNNFVFLRYQLGYTRPNMDKFYPERTNHYTGETEINGAHGLTAQVLLTFAFQFKLPDVTGKVRESREARAQNDELQTREHPRVASEVNAASAEPRTAASTGGSAPRPIVCSVNSDCSDGLFCNGEETCNNGICVPGTLPDDNIACTQLVCDEERREFRFEPLHGLCGDGLFCNGIERCDVNLGCIAGTPIPLDDGNPCTREYCDEENTRIVSEPIEGCGVQ